MSLNQQESANRLAGQSILITGGGSGIGASTAEYLAQQDALVTIAGRRQPKLEEIGNRIGERCAVVSGDITVHADRVRMVERAIAHGGKLDALVNNAGNMYRGPLQSLNQEQLLAIFNTNVVAGMMLSAQCVDALTATKGAIVFIGSIHTRRTFPEVSPYAATKAAIEAVTKSFAAELGPCGIRVNCVAPGAVFTEINQRAGLLTDTEALERLHSMSQLSALGRIGQSEEVAEAIGYFICAPWTTGTILEVDGGLSLGLTPDVL